VVLLVLVVRLPVVQMVLRLPVARTVLAVRLPVVPAMVLRLRVVPAMVTDNIDLTPDPLPYIGKGRQFYFVFH